MFTHVLAATLQLITVNGEALRCTPGTEVTLNMIQDQVNTNKQAMRSQRGPAKRLARSNVLAMRALRSNVLETQCMTRAAFRQGNAIRNDAPRHPGQRHQRGASMSAETFAHYVRTLSNEAYDSSRLRLLQNTLTAQCLTVADAKQILQTFTYDSGRKNAMDVMAPYIVDTQNRFLLRDAFTYSSGANSALAMLAQTPSIDQCRT